MKSMKTKTWEEECAEFNCAGFRGYHDESPEAKQRRRWDDMKRRLDKGHIIFMASTIVVQKKV